MANNDFLAWNVPIVNPESGQPTPDFIRFLLGYKTSINGNVPDSRKINTGTGLHGGGDLSSDRTLSLDATLNELNDVNAPSPTNGEVLTYDAGTHQWEAAASVGGAGYVRDGILEPNSGPVGDAYAVQGARIVMLGDSTVAAVIGSASWLDGTTYQGFVYEIDPTTAAVLSTVAQSATYTFPASLGGYNGHYVFPLSSATPLVSGHSYALCIQRIGNGPTAGVQSFYHAGTNGYGFFPANVLGAIAWQIDGPVPNGSIPGINSSPDKQPYWSGVFATSPL